MNLFIQFHGLKVISRELKWSISLKLTSHARVEIDTFRMCLIRLHGKRIELHGIVLLEKCSHEKQKLRGEVVLELHRKGEN